jgi:peptidoglycan-associated lipoprotein
MKHLKRASLILAMIALGACSQNGAGGFGRGYGGSSATDAQSDPSNPASPAYFQQSVGDRIFFAVDQSTVDASAQVALNAQAEWLVANPDYKVIIEGHADERGTRDYNLALGARRAGSVREYLTLRGVSADRIQTVSYGKERPSELCSAESCYAMNRRGVTVLSNLSF